MQKSSEGGQLTLFDLDTSFGKMCPAPSPVENPRAKTSGASWKKSSKLKYAAYQSLDLTPGAGNLLGEFFWETLSPWRGDASMLNTGVSPREEKESSLSQILEAAPQKKYYLSKTACLGILRRARERGKQLPEVQKRRLQMYFFDGLTYEEIAVREGCSYQAVQKSIAAALKKIRKFLK